MPIPYTDKYIDLHIHLDGAVTVDMARRLADIQGIPLPEDDSELEKKLTASPDCQNLVDFLRCFDFPLSLMQTREGLEEASYLLAERMRSQNVLYAEIRYAPQFHTARGMTQEQSVCAVLDGIRRSGLKANVILCCMRGADNEAQNRETLELTRKYLTEDGGVVAMDLAGVDTVVPTQDYVALLAKAVEYGIPLTLHAGEATGPETVREAIHCGAVRIGHGVRACADESVLRLIKERGVFLEVCPTSNRMTKAVDDMRRYPFMDFLRRGIRVTLNTDDPGVEGTTIAGEYRYMEKAFGLTGAQERILLANSVDAAFTSQAVKAQLRRALEIE